MVSSLIVETMLVHEIVVTRERPVMVSRDEPRAADVLGKLKQAADVQNKLGRTIYSQAVNKP